ncbi:hypothetical protein QQ045_020160 [Rhodiola kirilowii]
MDVEGTALYFGMDLARNMGLRKVTFSSDKAEVIEALLTKSYILTKERKWIKDCYEMMESYREWKLEHVLRDANAAADHLVHKARDERWSWTAMDAIPICLSSAVLRDRLYAGLSS